MGFVRSRVFSACAASIATALIVGGVAFAVQSPVDGNGVVHACYNAKTGAVILNVNGSCPRTGDNTPITWSVTGPPGPPGSDAQSAHVAYVDIGPQAALSPCTTSGSNSI